MGMGRGRMMSIEEVFEKYEDEYLEFDKIKNKLSNRYDVHAFIMLDKLVPGTQDMISASEHDEYYLSIDIEELGRVATEEQIRDLIRCCVRYDSDYDCLCLFA
jgi:hypothetical protein